MGTGNLINQADGEIADAADVQQVIDALKQNFVPRNSSGVPTDQAGDLGTSVLRWGQTYVSKLILGAIANGLSIEELVAEIVLKVDSNVVATIGADGIERESMKLFTPQESSAITLTTTSTTFLDSATTVSITTTGGPVWVGLMSTDTTGFGGSLSAVGSAGTIAAAVGALFRIRRDTTAIVAHRLTLQNNKHTVASDTMGIYVPCSSLWCIDTPSAGTYVYSVGTRSEIANGTSATVNTAKIVAYEIR